MGKTSLCFQAQEKNYPMKENPYSLRPLLDMAGGIIISLLLVLVPIIALL
jgi:hypothetical protein